MRAFVSVPQCFRHVGTCVQLLSPLIFCLVSKWRKCIVRGADKQPNTNTGFFLDTKWVDCSDFEHNARNLTLKGTLHEDD